MINQELAKIFNDIARFLRIENVAFKPYAYEKAAISLEDLKDDVAQIYIQGGRKALEEISGIGKAMSDHIEEYLKHSKGRSLLQDILPVAREVLKVLEQLKEVQRASLAGSLRRRKETIGDVDFLVVSKNPKKTMDFFVALPGVQKIWGKGGTKASVHVKGGFDMDLRVVPEKSYGSALQYFTGSQAHNIATRKIAIDKGLKLSEYGVFKGSKQIAGKTEEDVYKAIGLPYVEPELREDQGEIDAALHGALPKLIELKNIKGDLHCHSNWNGGEHSIEVMAKTAMEKGYEYIGISDHSKTLKIENGLSEKKLLEQIAYS